MCVFSTVQNQRSSRSYFVLPKQKQTTCAQRVLLIPYSRVLSEWALSALSVVLVVCPTQKLNFMYAPSGYGNTAAVATPSYFRGGVCEPQPGLELNVQQPGTATNGTSGTNNGTKSSREQRTDTIKLNIAALQKEVADAEAEIAERKQEKAALQAAMKSISDAYVSAHAKQKAMREQFWKSQASKNFRSMKFAHEHGAAVRNLILQLVEQQGETTSKMDETDRLIQDAKYKRVSARLNLVKETAEAKRQLELDILENERNLEQAMAVARYRPAYSTTNKRSSKKRRALKHRRSSTSSSDSSSIEDESDDTKRSSRSSRSSSDVSSDSSVSKQRIHKSKKDKKNEVHADINDPVHSKHKLIAAKTELIKLQKVREQLANKLRRLESHKDAGYLLSGGGKHSGKHSGKQSSGYRRNVRHLQKELERLDRLIRQHEAKVRYYDTFVGPSTVPVANQAAVQASVQNTATAKPVSVVPAVAATSNNALVTANVIYDDDSDESIMFNVSTNDVQGRMYELVNRPAFRICPDGKKDFVAFMSDYPANENSTKSVNKKTPLINKQTSHAGTNNRQQMSFEGYITRDPSGNQYMPSGRGILTTTDQGKLKQYRGTFAFTPDSDNSSTKVTFTGLLLQQESPTTSTPLKVYFTKSAVFNVKPNNRNALFDIRRSSIKGNFEEIKRGNDKSNESESESSNSTSESESSKSGKSNRKSKSTFKRVISTSENTDKTEVVYNNKVAVVFWTGSGNETTTEIVWWEENCFAQMRLQLHYVNNKLIFTRAGCGFKLAHGTDQLQLVARTVQRTYPPQPSLSVMRCSVNHNDSNSYFSYYNSSTQQKLDRQQVDTQMILFGLPSGFSVKENKQVATRAYLNGSLFGTAEFKKKAEEDDDDDSRKQELKQFVRKSDSTFESKEYVKGQPTVAGGGRLNETDSESNLIGGLNRQTEEKKEEDKEQRKSKLDPKWIAEFESYCTKLARNFKTAHVDERESLLQYVAVAIEKVQQALKTDTRLETRNQLARPAHLLLEAMTPFSEDNLAFSESFKLACFKLKQLFPLKREDNDNDEGKDEDD